MRWAATRVVLLAVALADVTSGGPGRGRPVRRPAPAAAASEPESRLRDVFRGSKCGCVRSNAEVARFGQGRTWLLEVNPWGSHRVVTVIAAILLREHLGYDVDLNVVASASGAYQRAAKNWTSSVYSGADGEAVAERLRAHGHFSYANMEVWPVGKLEQFYSLVGHFLDAGPLGYEGHSGWFVADRVARDPAFPLTPEFYRAYDTSRKESGPLYAALRRHYTVACASPHVCRGASADAPQPNGTASCWALAGGAEGKEVQWCHAASDGKLPAVISVGPGKEAGFNEEIARSHNFRFALRYVGKDRFLTEAARAFERSSPQVVHTWRPSIVLSAMKLRGVGLTRIIMPNEGCGNHSTDGTGDWSCDFPTQALRKVASKDADSFAKHFLFRFNIPERGLPLNVFGGQRPAAGGLEGAGIHELLQDIASRVEVETDGDLRVPKSEEVFDAACDWICANQDQGLNWPHWVDPHRVPAFADTTMPFHATKTLLMLLLVSLVYILLLENPWLWTTLSLSSVRNILAKNESVHWRSGLEARLWKPDSDSESLSSERSSAEDTEATQVRLGGIQTWTELSKQRCVPADLTDLPDGYWEGLVERSVATPILKSFWARVDSWIAEAKGWTRLPPRVRPPSEDLVSFAHHTFPCLQAFGSVNVFLRRSAVGANSGTELVVEVIIEEISGGAKAGKDFEASRQQIEFPVGVDQAVMTIPVVNHKDIWNKSYVFQARLVSVVRGSAVLATPAQAQVLVLDDDAWPANIPATRRAGQGISMLTYFIRQDRLRRGEKWTKTLMAMLWLPVHSVVVDTLVQKVLVDHALAQILAAPDSRHVHYFYVECVLLVGLQLFSLGLNRWADVVQTRNRGRTGGCRQVHRSDLLHKFMHLEHSEHWEADEANWLYSTTYDADVITGKAYFAVFVLFQSCFAIFLSLAVVVYLQWLTKGSHRSYFNGPMPLLVMVFFAMAPLSLLGVWTRSKLTWVVVIARKTAEMAWFKSCTWILSNWRLYYGLLRCEREALERRVLQQNADFVPKHWDARDTMNDTAWITIWMQGVSYCFVLMFGIFALIDAQRYGIGFMEVGTFYALCKINLSMGKNIGRLSRVFVDMQQAVVSLREIAALLNQTDLRSQRQEARRWRQNGALGRYEDPTTTIRFDAGMCFMRPSDNRVGSTFAELRLRAGVELPLERVVHVTAKNESVLRSFLGLAAQVIHPTSVGGEDVPKGAPRVGYPRGLRLIMIPAVPVTVGVSEMSILDQLEFTGAPRSLCAALAGSLGLAPERVASSLGPGSAQVFSIVRALLVDPDVLVAYRPLALVPIDVRAKVASLLRFWQSCGGLPTIARLLQEPLEQQAPPVYRPPGRTLVLGNSLEEFSAASFSLDVRVDLEALLWKGGPVAY